MKIRIHELATKEFDDAIIWYDQQSEGLGKRFKKTVKDSIKKISNNPEWYLKESMSWRAQQNLKEQSDRAFFHIKTICHNLKTAA